MDNFPRSARTLSQDSFPGFESNISPDNLHSKNNYVLGNVFRNVVLRRIYYK